MQGEVRDEERGGAMNDSLAQGHRLMGAAGRGIDALVAEHVMGWGELVGASAVVAAGHAPPGNEERFHYRRVWVDSYNQRMACEECGTLPGFSADPAASKQLRDKMRTDGWKSCLFSTDIFTMRFWGYKRGQDTVEAYADTEEMAVALAALKAKGIEVTNV